MSNFANVTETERLRLQLADMQAELRRRDMDAVRAELAAENSRREAEERKAADASRAAAAAETETARKNAWISYRSKDAIAKGDEAFRSFLTGDQGRHVSTGWPPGSDPSLFHIEAIVDVDAEGKASKLGKMLGL